MDKLFSSDYLAENISMATSGDFITLLRQRYPNAISSTQAVDRFLIMIHDRLGLVPGQIMSANSICCDDVNVIERPDRAFEMLGPFTLGGLSGFPFAGLTGMSAFSHHVPHDGALFIFFGPHIGLTKGGRIGEIYRNGQEKSSPCCGAATAAVNKLLQNEIIDNQLDDLDYQQHTLEQILLRARDRVANAGEPLVEATEVIYEAIERRIKLLVKRTRFPARYVVLCGGIVINGDYDIGSFLAPRRFVCLDAGTGLENEWLPDFSIAHAPTSRS